MAIQASFLSSSQDLMEINGCGGLNYLPFFNIQQDGFQLNSQLQQLDSNHGLMFDDKSVPVSNSYIRKCLKSDFCSRDNLSMDYLQNMVAIDRRQREETDQCIASQNERLRILLEQQRKHQNAVLLKLVESRTMPLLQRKEEEISQTARRRQELEELVNKLEMENETWKRIAQEKEAMVVSLNNTLQGLRERGSCLINDYGTEDAESCCGEVETEKINGGFVNDKNGMVCRRCEYRNSCMLFLPCRHLSSCKVCEAFLHCCPVCQTEKKACIEASLV